MPLPMASAAGDGPTCCPISSSSAPLRTQEGACPQCNLGCAPLQVGTHLGSGESAGTWGLARACLPRWRKQAGPLFLGQPLPWRGRLGGQLFGRRQVLLNAAQCDCHAAPAQQRECLQPVRCRTHTAKPGKSPFGLTATVLACRSPREAEAT